MPHPTCTIPGCEKPTRTKSADWCKMHYHRWYRTGDPGDAAPRIRDSRSEHCEVEGCFKPDTEGGLCSMHAARKRRHGDVHKVLAPHEYYRPTGEAHHAWAGDLVGYTAAHDRVRRRRGSATGHACEDCGKPARHWSYNHDDPDELIEFGLSKSSVAYSPNPDHYSPRCVSCHKVFDLGRADAARA